MKKNKKLFLIILTTVFLFIIIVLLFFINKKNNNTENTNEIINEVSDEDESSNEIVNENVTFKQVSIQKNAEKLTNPSEYYIVSDCINILINNINKKDNEGVYNIIDGSYIKNNNINKEQILNYIGDFKLNKYFYAEEMYKISGTVNIFYSKGYLDNEDPQQIIFVLY